MKYLSITLAVAVVLCAGSAYAATINVATWADLVNATPASGDTVNFTAASYTVTAPVAVVSGVTYSGTATIDCAGMRAFTAWGDRGATDGQVDGAGEPILNSTGQTGWTIDGLTFTGGQADAVSRQDILSTARDLLDNYADRLAAVPPTAPYDTTTANDENGAIGDNPTWFDLLDGNSDGSLTDVELQAYLDGNPPGSPGHLIVNDGMSTQGGAIMVSNGASGTISNCTFTGCGADASGGDGGAICYNGGGGGTNTISDCTFTGNTCEDEGGAMRLGMNNSTFVVTGCSFTDNVSLDDGGALKLNSGGPNGSTFTLTDCTFTTNHVEDGDDGGAMDCTASDSTYVFDGCTFTGNYNMSDDGAAVKYANNRSNLTVSDCVFIGNGKDGTGTSVGDQGIFVVGDDDAGPVTMTNCIFADNEDLDDNIVELKIGTMTNCTFVANTSGDRGIVASRGRAWDSTGDGTDDVVAGTTEINNTLFVNNNAHDGYVVGYTRNDPAFTTTVTNCLFFGNVDASAAPATNIESGSNVFITEVGSVTGDPLLDASYMPQEGSAAIDAGDPATAAATDITGATRDSKPDIGAYEAAAVVVTDTDGDGMPDDWETANGLNPNDPSDATGDPDGDGLTNLQEYNLGSDPNQPASQVKEGAPVAGTLGLGLVAAAFALGGSLFLRKKD